MSMIVVFSLLVAVVSAVPTITVSRFSATHMGITYAQTANQGFIIFGFTAASGGTTITSGVACNTGANGTCIEIVCTGAVGTCTLATAGTEVYSGFTPSANSFSFTRDLTRSPSVATLPNVYMAWAETTNAATPLNIAAVTGSGLTPVAITPTGSPLYTVATPTWGLTFSRTSQTGIAATLVPAAGQTVFLGWKASTFAPNPAPEGVICTLAASGTCVEFACTITNGVPTCTTPAAAASNFTTNAVTSTSAIVTVKTVGAITIGDTMFLSHTSVATTQGPFTATSAQTQQWSEYSTATPIFLPTTVPTFPVNFSRPTETSLGISIVPPTGKMVFFGWRSGESITWPADAVICAAGAVNTCLDVSCSAAATCISRATTIFTTNTVTATSITLARLLASGNVPLSATTKMWLAHDNIDTPAGTTSLAATAAQSRTWSYYSADVPPFLPVTVPTFTVTLSRPVDTTLGISIVPPAERTIFFGWRSGESITWPADAVICAAGAVNTCLDVSCSAAATCISRATTIFTTNTVTATSITLARLLASGNVPLSATTKMWLAHDNVATPAGTTSLAATAAQSRTWSYYSADVPAVGTNSAKTLIPSVIAGLCAILYVL